MSGTAPTFFFLASDTATTRLGAMLARHLQRGDTVLLSGSIGAGKTHLARALIQSRLGRAEDVPSPTFTLVQSYDAGDTEIWHADLYRLSHPNEAFELGLEDAFETAICLVEWPDRLGSLTPASALRVTLQVQGEGRTAQLSGGRCGLIAAISADWGQDA